MWPKPRGVVLMDQTLSNSYTLYVSVDGDEVQCIHICHYFLEEMLTYWQIHLFDFMQKLHPQCYIT